MRATLEKLENNRAVLSVSVDKELVQQALTQASRKIAKRVNIPGFRKGKAPRRLIERYVGKETLWQEAIDPLLNRAYAEAIKETGIQPIDRPEIDVVRMEEGEDFEFKASVDVLPEVPLGDYTQVRVNKEVGQVDPEMVEKELEAIRERHAELVQVEDGQAQNGSFVSIDFKGYINGEEFPGGSAEGYLLELGSGVFIGNFEEQLIGVKAGEERKIEVQFPDDYRDESLAGKLAVFDVKVNEIKEKRLPELNDELAAEEGAENLEELRKKVQNNLEKRLEAEAERAFEEEIIKQVVDQVDLVLPPVLIERHLDHLVEALRRELAGSGIPLESYLASADKTMEDLRNDLRERAENDVKTELVLDAIADREQITVTDEEVDRDIDQSVEQYGQMADAVREYMKRPENFANLAEGLRKRKTIQFLKELAEKNATETETAAADADNGNSDAEEPQES